MNSEKGQTFPLALIALAVGSLVISPFLGHASSMLTGSRIYGQAITEQYSCDAGIEWALWKLKRNPLLTTNPNYTLLEPIPSEINSSSFPITEIKFVVEDGEDIVTETLEWWSDSGWNEVHLLDILGASTMSLLIETEADHVKVKLYEGKHPLGVYDFMDPPDDPPHELELEIDSEGLYEIHVQTPSEGALVTTTVTITYPVVIYDIRARKDNTIITARAKASYLGVGVISWQVE
ncbi:hypothetical protein ES703_68588 [subsurface metagenome]